MNRPITLFILFIGIMILTRCNGTLSDDQRKRLKEGMKRNEIRKISEAQITDGAFDLGRILVKKIGPGGAFSTHRKDSLEYVYKVKIRVMRSGDASLGDIERQVVDAYAHDSSNGHAGDNVQRMGKDSILYTQPVMTELPDGSRNFNYALGISTSRKQIVLSIKD